jgi:putative transposase
VIVKAFKYRIYPTKAQEKALVDTLYLTRELYNAALEERREAYKKCKKSVNVYEQKRCLPEIKEARPEFKNVHAHVLQDTLFRLDKSFSGFFNRAKKGIGKAGFPRFKSADRWDSFTFPQVWDTPNNRWFGPGKPLEPNRIYIPKIGSVKIKFHRVLEGKPKTLTIKREANHWYAVYTCEVQNKLLETTGSVIGIDLGTNPNFLITSDAEFEAAPRYYVKAQRKLRTAQRSLSKKKRGSRGRKQAKARVAKLHCKTANQRKDFHHKTARKLIDKHDVIYHENLNIIGLARSRTAKGVLDSGWASFLTILSNKAAEAGRRVQGVDPKFTSQNCSNCGHRQKVAIGKKYVCAKCNLEINRDVNAALNILRLGQDLPLDEGNAVARPRRLQKPPPLGVG